MSETYQQGTVSVVKNSHTVIGQDTYFEQLGNIEAGSLLTLDNQTHYLITEVISDNELVIETLVTRLPYQGETVTDAPYVVTKSFSRQTNTGLIAELTEFQASFIDKQLAFYEWAFNASDTYSFTAGEAVREILTPEGIANKLAQKSSEEGIYTSVTSDNTLVWVRNKNGTTWTPSNTATAITISFLKAGEVIGAKVVTATLNTTAGTINISETANTGQATTLTTTNNNTAAPTISVMHDASKATVTQALSALASGEAGPKGEVGKAGPQGVRGIQGPAGQVRYTWLRYADTAAGEGISNSPVGKTYVGFAHNKTTPIESNTPTDYVWTKIKGEDGVNGTDGIPGKDGENTYTWIKYSQYFDGTGLTNVPDDNTRYIGIAYNKTTPQESTVKTDYVWSKFKGEDGSRGPQGEQGIQGPAGNDGVSNYFHIAYADSSDGSTNFNQSAGDYVGTYVDNNPTDSTNPNDYNWVRWKGAQGNDGSDGIAGTNGVDGKTSYLHIAYANSADGTVGFNQSAGEYIGQYVDFTLADSTNPASYQWAKIKGEAGKDGVDGADGQNGTDGRRGSEHYYISTTGSAWSNSLANSATEGNNVVGDRVTITNFTNGWTQTRFWNSSGQWDDTQLTVIDGALVVNVEAIIPKIFANTIEASDTIRAVNGETTVQMSAVEDAALFVARGNRVLFSVGDESGDILDGLALRPSSVQGDALSEDALAAIQKFLGTSVANTGGRVSKEFTFDTLNQSQRLLVTLKHGSSPISMQVSVATRWFYDDAIPDSRDAEFRIEYRAQGTSAWTILHYGTLTARIASQYPDGSATLVATYDASEVVNPSTGTYEFRVFIVSADPIFNEPIGGTLILSENAAGSVTAWKQLEDIPATATRWPSFGEVSGFVLTSQLPARIADFNDGILGHTYTFNNSTYFNKPQVFSHDGISGVVEQHVHTDNYLRFRFGGNADVQGISLSNYDTTTLYLTREGTIKAQEFKNRDGAELPNQHYKTNATDLNNYSTKKTSFNTIADSSGIGLGAWQHVIHMHHSDENGYAGQIAMTFGTAPELRFRAANSSGFGSWRKVWTDINHGENSGLDADKLDGLHASAFLRTDSTHATNMRLGKYIYFRDYDDGDTASGIKSYVRDGVWRMFKDANTPANIDINLDGNYVYHEGRKPTSLVSLGSVTAMPTGRNTLSSGIHHYGTYNDTSNTPHSSKYGESIVWGEGAGGSIEIWGGWVGGGWGKLYTRALRNVTDNWSDWYEIYTSRDGVPWDKLTGRTFAHLNASEGYWGLNSGTDGSSGGWIRTPLNGLIPYSSGVSSSLGTSSWKFTNLNVKYAYMDQASVTEGLTVGYSITLDSASHANLTIDRASTAYDNNIMFKTAGSIKWRLWMGAGDEKISFRHESTAKEPLVITENEVEVSNLSVVGGVGKLRVISSGTIAGSSFNNGWLQVGDAANGWAFDPNEIYCSGEGIIGTLSGDLQLRASGYVDIKGSKLTAGDSGALRIQSATGYIDVGSKNSSYAHFYTDRSQYYMDKPLRVDGDIQVYGTSSQLTADGNHLIIGPNGNYYSRLTNNGRINRRNNGWANNSTERTIFDSSWASDIGDHILLHAVGNITTNGALVMGREAFAIGRHDHTNLAPSSLHQVFSTDTWMAVTPATMAFRNKEAFRFSDSWLRINEGKAFSGGIYCGGSTLRTDGALQVGGSGNAFNATTNQIDLKVTTRVHGYMQVKEIRSQDGNFTTIGAGELGNDLYSHVTSTHGTGNEGVHIGGEHGVYLYSHSNNMSGGMAASYSIRPIASDGATYINHLDVYKDQNNASQIVARFRHPNHNANVAIVSKNNDAGSFRFEANMDNQELRIQTADTAGNFFTSSVSVGTIASFRRNGDVIITGELSTADTKARSDKRVKRKLRTISHALDKVNTLTGYTYDEINLKKRMASIIAQDVQKVLPEAVGKDTDGMLNVSPMALIGLLVNAVKELSGQVRELQHGNV